MAGRYAREPQQHWWHRFVFSPIWSVRCLGGLVAIYAIAMSISVLFLQLKYFHLWYFDMNMLFYSVGPFGLAAYLLIFERRLACIPLVLLIILMMYAMMTTITYLNTPIDRPTYRALRSIDEAKSTLLTTYVLIVPLVWALVRLFLKWRMLKWI